jgi:WhiB family transcriptional regulator, redox-sensing transcriptional regulator
MIEYVSEWRAASACLNTDPDVFFPVAVGSAASKQVARAMRICAGCTVRQQCLDFAMRSGEKDGIWGGTTPEERVRARRNRNRRPAHRAWQAVPDVRAS